ncbi:E3 ubiquitin-protein ligase RBBP6-like isoform X3 [Hippocampus zosterae]|uniref:E3 ubiquitin-protein ligase RBBP6-like isoform X3 n=1 Tax=Hippocampus zosterae TaxID=109293 RepID=UPI00223E7E43|nr:E3 ubiquitin-protein ligase RBBP6-like isoform X3 [Hippocampus zosterae]
MDRYGDLNMDLECDGGDVAQKTFFGGMFKRSSKSSETQDNLSVSSELSKSNDSLNGNTKDKGGMFKGMFKKQPKLSKEPQQVALSQHNPEFSVSNDSLDDSKPSKDKSGMLGGILKKNPKRGHARRPSQDLLDIDMSASNNNVNDNTKVALSQNNPALSDGIGSLDEAKPTKEKSGVLGGILKKTPKRGHARRPSQDLLDIDMSANHNTVNDHTKENSGMLRKSPKIAQDDLSANDEQSGSSNNLATNNKNAKESAGMFSGMFKKSPKLLRNKSQDDLSQSSELSASSENLSEGGAKEKGGFFSGMFKKPKQTAASRTQSQEDLTAASELFASNDSLAEKMSKDTSTGSKENLTEKPKVKQNGFSAMMKNAFSLDKPEKENSDADVSEEMSDTDENQTGHKRSKLAGAMNMLNPFRSGKDKHSDSSDDDTPAASDKSSGHKQKDTEDTEVLIEADKQMEGKQKLKNNGVDREQKQRSETSPLPHQPAQEEKNRVEAQAKATAKPSEDAKVQTFDNKNMTSRERADKEAPKVPPNKPSQEELRRRAANTTVPKQDNQNQGQSDDERLKEDGEGNEVTPVESKKKHKHFNPFMPRGPAKPPSDDKGPTGKEEEEDKEVEDATNKSKEVKVKKPKRHNPFMPRVKNKAAQRRDADAENEGRNRGLFERLEEFRIDPSQPEDRQDMEGLMEWWNNVESWEDTPQDEDMSDKEEAKAFAVTAEKVQKGIRVFNKLFSERAESLWQHVIDLNGIADGLDKFNKNTKIAQITGGSTSAIGGVATIAGLALAPVTFGTSLIVTAVGLGVATAGGLTSAGAGISNQVNNSMDRKKVEKIVQDYQEKMADLNKCLKFIKQGIENLRRFDLIKMKNNAYNRDFPVLSSSFYEDGAMAGKAILINANEIMRVVQIANVAGSTAARAVQIASMATGVLTGLFVGMDIYFVAKDSKELKKGAKSEFAGKIREVATQLHDGLVELNTIREELQGTTTPEDQDHQGGDGSEGKDKKTGGYDYDSSEEDEIDRIKKAIKKDLDNREYV